MLNDISNPLSYKFIQNSIKDFRSLRRNEFNLYDEPGTFWFKPIFYFYRGDDDDFNNAGLLHPSWLGKGGTGDGAGDSTQSRQEVMKNTFVTSAYNYLMRNDEIGRARMLQQFINLLSNISSNSPWYFQEVAGLDAAIDHTENFKTGKFVGDDRKQITFTLLPDAVDDRIGTLMDLYRSICYDWRSKREVVPANLRKFDMGLYIHGSMIQNSKSDILHSRIALSGALKAGEKLGIGYESDQEFVNAAGQYSWSSTGLSGVDLDEDELNSLKSDNSIKSTSITPKGQSHVYIEFINCEIDLSSTKGGDTISNAEGSERKYTLTISYDDCYINRYNDFVIGAIGDVVLSTNVIEVADEMGLPYYALNNDTTIGRPAKSNSLLATAGRKAVQTAVSATLGSAIQIVQNTVGNVVLGNLYKGSLTNIANQLANGRIDAVGGLVQQVVDADMYKRAGSLGKESLNNTVRNELDQVKSNLTGRKMYEAPNRSNKTKLLGNLYKSVGAANNL